MFDVLNKITVDAIIAPVSTGERACCATHFLKMMPNDLVLLDRGYPAYWLLNLIVSFGGHFCARVPNNKWVSIKKFFRSGKLQKIIRLQAPATSVAKCRELGLDTQDLTVRLIRIELDNGETEILITSLTDIEMYPAEIFSDLYHLRWPVEEDYKVMKCRMEIENFTGKSVLSVNKADDLEKLCEKALLKEFEEYRASIQKRLKVFRLEVVRAGFKKAWQERDYATIIAVARKIPEDVLQEDPKLLMWYDQAVTRMGGE